MPFAALVIIHSDIMISFFSFYSSPKKNYHLVICTSTHTVRSIKSSFCNNSSGFHKCSLTFGHSAMSRWKPQARKLKSEKSVQSYCREAWNWLFTYSIFYRRHSECISQLETRVKSHNSTCEIVVLHTIETCIFNHGFELLLQRKKNKGTND